MKALVFHGPGRARGTRPDAAVMAATDAMIRVDASHHLRH